jgi:beta-galactosidase
VFATGRTLGADVQSNLATYVQKGGKLLLVGLLPDQDHDGAPCTVLAEALGLKSAGIVYDGAGLDGEAPYWPTVATRGSLVPRAEERVSVAQLLTFHKPKRRT